MQAGEIEIFIEDRSSLDKVFVRRRQEKKLLCFFRTSIVAEHVVLGSMIDSFVEYTGRLGLVWMSIQN